MLLTVHNKWDENERLAIMTSEIDSADLLSRASQLIDLAKAAGADQADAVVVRSRSRSVSVRLGKVEGTEASESDDFSLRVFVGKQVASVSANPGFDMKVLAERAVAMAKVSPKTRSPASRTRPTSPDPIPTSNSTIPPTSRPTRSARCR